MARVLVVDADPSIRTLVREVLALDRYDVDLADGLELALASLRGQCYDLVFTDTLEPPDEARNEALARIKASAGSTPIVLFTGYQQVVDLGAEGLGVAAVLPKPVDLDSLLGTVRTAISGS